MVIWKKCPRGRTGNRAGNFTYYLMKLSPPSAGAPAALSFCRAGVLADVVLMPVQADLFKEIPVCIDFLPCYGIDNIF
jgi:hypothetical protein